MSTDKNKIWCSRSKECGTVMCTSMFTSEEEKKAAIKWGSTGTPIIFEDLSDHCMSFTYSKKKI